jgi:hypothetical protein
MEIHSENFYISDEDVVLIFMLFPAFFHAGFRPKFKYHLLWTLTESVLLFSEFEIVRPVEFSANSCFSTKPRLFDSSISLVSSSSVEESNPGTFY